MANILSIHHACVEVNDIEDSLRYYREKMGFELIDRETCGFGEYAMLRYGAARVELIQRQPTTPNIVQPEGPLAHIGFEVDDVEGIFNELKKRGIIFKTEEVERCSEPLGGLVACSTVGPCGEVLSFYHFLKQI